MPSDLEAVAREYAAASDALDRADPATVARWHRALVAMRAFDLWVAPVRMGAADYRQRPGFRPVGIAEAAALKALAAGARDGLGDAAFAIGPGACVLDLDTKSGRDLEELVSAVRDHCGPLGPTLTQRSRSGGRHLVYWTPSAVRGAKPAPWAGRGVDVLAAPGIVAAAGSGEGAARVRVIDARPPAAVPRAVLEAHGSGAGGAAPVPGWGDGIGADALADVIAAVRPLSGALEGSRSETLYRAVAKARDAGATEAQALEVARALNATFRPPLEDPEVRATVRNLGRYGRREPGSRPPFPDPARIAATVAAVPADRGRASGGEDRAPAGRASPEGTGVAGAPDTLRIPDSAIARLAWGAPGGMSSTLEGVPGGMLGGAWCYADLVPHPEAFGADSCLVVTAPDGAGKSVLVLDLAFAAARGAPWAGEDFRGEPVGCIYVAGEGARVQMQRAVAQHMERDGVSGWRPGVWIADAAAAGIATIAAPGNTFGALAACLDAGAAALAAAGFRAAFAVIDTAASLQALGPDENDAAGVAAHVRGLLACASAVGVRHRMDLAAVLVHHDAKSGGMRGSGALSAMAGQVLRVRREAPEGAPAAHGVEVVKSRFGGRVGAGGRWRFESVAIGRHPRTGELITAPFPRPLEDAADLEAAGLEQSPAAAP